MRWYTSLITFLHPSRKVRNTAWFERWQERQRVRFISNARVFLSIASVLYLAHNLFIDIPLRLQPPSLWLMYRLGMTGVAVSAWALTYYRPLSQRSHLYWLPTAIAGIVFSYFQARSMTWFDRMPFVYALMTAALSTIVLQRSILQSSLYLLLLFGIQARTFHALGLTSFELVGAGAITFACVIIMRTPMLADVNQFFSDQVNLEIQEKLLHSEKELSQQIRAFLPTEIYRRIVEVRHRRKLSFHDAIEEVLLPTRKQIACVFSDIRGYTQRSKFAEEFTRQSVIPNIRACTELVEAFHGIPKHVGDLIFAYFDASDERLNIQRALNCGLQLADTNHLLNLSLDEDIWVERFVLISYGTAIVGNIGGNKGSREITTMGTPANVLARIDEITKVPAFRAILPAEALILASEAAHVAQLHFPKLDLMRVELGILGLSLRDFPEESAVYFLPLTSENRQALRTSHWREDESPLAA